MAAENTDIDQKLEDVTIENNATAEEVVVEELTVEEQLTRDLAQERISF
jgi:molecular chaperone GrpE